MKCIRLLKTRVFPLLVFTLLLFVALAFNSLAGDENSTAGIVATKSSNLNIRSGGSTEESIIGKAPKGGILTLLAREGDFWIVQYGANNYGYASAQYITELGGTAARVKTSGGNLNVRDGGSIEYPAVDKLANGDYIVVLSEKDGWAGILYDGNKTGFVSTTYLTKMSRAATPTYSAISLSVPAYRQYDTRWAYREVGSSGKNVYNIGCTLTCLAMSQSYIGGETVTPNDILDTCSFTSGGALYWPSGYTRSVPEDYLAFIYGKLAAGIPVIVHAQKEDGTAHWVIVTGVRACEKLTADAFTINDPATVRRTSLADYMAVYPNFVKCVYAN